MTSASVRRAVAFLKKCGVAAPETAVILGSGLQELWPGLSPAVDVPYQEIRGWPVGAVAGHAGRFVAGELAGRQVALLLGRAHRYEGFSARELAFPVSAVAGLGAVRLFVTCAAGAVNPDFNPGDLVLITDHINLQGADPSAGPASELPGPLFTDMTEAYSPHLRRMARAAADRLGMKLREGVYAAVIGPSYETPAEVRYLRTIGADLVGMSTVPEVIAARRLGLDVLGVACVTNRAAGLAPTGLSHAEVLIAGSRVQPALAALLSAVIEGT